MSKNENLTQQEEQQLASIFAQLKESKIEAPLYMKTRILAHLAEDKKQKKSLFFWKALSLGSLASLGVALFVTFQMVNKKTEEALTKQAYVIHVDFNQMDQQMVAGAEIELPDDVRFVSSNKEIQKEKRLKLPVSVKSLGRGKLPFVVTSDLAGEKSIRVRLLNEKNELVREQIFKVQFAKEGSSVAF